MTWDKDTLQLISVTMSLASDGWRHRVYYESHPLGIVPCIEFSKVINGETCFHTFYNAEELWEWVRSPSD